MNPFTPACDWRHFPLRHNVCLEAPAIPHRGVPQVHRNIDDIIYKIEKWERTIENHQNYKQGRRSFFVITKLS